MIPGPPCGYTDLIDYALDSQEDYPQAFPLRPSAAGDCGRKLAYDLMVYRGYLEAEQEDMAPNVRRLLNLGHSVEWHSIQNFNLLPKLNPDIKVKYKQATTTLFKLDPINGKEQELIEGSLDLAVFISNEGGIGDVKSTKDKFDVAFKTHWDAFINKMINMSSTKRISDTAVYVEDLQAFLKELQDPFFAKNFIQLNLYCCSQFAQERRITHGFIYRYCKNDSRHFEVRFKPDPVLLQDFQTKCNKINQAVDKKKPEFIKKDYNLGSIVCGFCRHKKHCWPGKDAQKEYFKTFPKRKWPVDIKSKKLKDLFKRYEQGLAETQLATLLEADIIKEMNSAKIQKIRLSNGNIYELKILKSGGKGDGSRMVLRRGKL